MPTISDYLLRTAAVGLPGLWIQLVNNLTSTAYVSTGATDANGLWTVTAPPGTYTVSTGPSAGGPWTATGDTAYIIPIRDDANIFWDEANSRLGIGTTTPAGSLHAKPPSGGTGLILDQFAAGDASILLRVAGANQWIAYVAGGNDLRFLNAVLGVDRLALTPAGHLLSLGPAPTLGALQAGIGVQSIVGTDMRGQITITTTGAPPGAGAVVAILNWATAYASTTYAVTLTGQGGSSWFWFATQLAGSISIFTGAALSGTATYAINYMVIG
jgi:hypothetical protein